MDYDGNHRKNEMDDEGTKNVNGNHRKNEIDDEGAEMMMEIIEKRNGWWESESDGGNHRKMKWKMRESENHRNNEKDDEGVKWWWKL